LKGITIYVNKNKRNKRKRKKRGKLKMMLFEIINYLFIAIRYGVWALGVLGILVSIVLILTNLSFGFSSALVFIASLFLSIAVSVFLLPNIPFILAFLGGKKLIVAAVSLVISIAIMGLVYVTNGGFPKVNLIFIRN